MNLGFDSSALSHECQDLPQHGALALEEIGLGGLSWPLGLASVSGGGRKPVVEVVKIAHSGRNNRGGLSRAPRPSPASR